MLWVVLNFPGSNNAFDAAYAVKHILKSPPILLSPFDLLPETAKVVIVPGGFSYGDYLRPGAMASRTPIVKQLKQRQKDLLILGICNGFQILLEAGLLPGYLLANKQLRFISEIVPIRVVDNTTPFTLLFSEGEVVEMPINHFYGAYHPISISQTTYTVVMKYVNNINGAYNNIAAITNSNKNILAMMPHPEQAMDEFLGSKAGIKVFYSIKAYLES